MIRARSSSIGPSPSNGSITVSISTGGENLPTGYMVVLDDSDSLSVDANGTVNFFVDSSN